MIESCAANQQEALESFIVTVPVADDCGLNTNNAVVLAVTHGDGSTKTVPWVTEDGGPYGTARAEVKVEVGQQGVIGVTVMDRSGRSTTDQIVVTNATTGPQCTRQSGGGCNVFDDTCGDDPERRGCY